MYIASIIAYYMFAEYPLLKKSWGSIGIAMLRLFSFVTVAMIDKILIDMQNTC